MTTRESWALARALDGELPEHPLPAGYRTSPWRSEHGAAVHALLSAAYADGGGSVDMDRARWQRDFEGDVEFDAQACALVFDPNGFIVGAILCWDSAFVKDLVTDSAQRRRGLASALLAQSMRHFARGGAPTLRLKVERDNTSGALALYERLGFLRSEDER